MRRAGASNKDPENSWGKLLNESKACTLPVVEGEPLIVAPVCCVYTIAHVGIAAFRCLPRLLNFMTIIKGPHLIIREELASLRTGNSSISQLLADLLPSDEALNADKFDNHHSETAVSLICADHVLYYNEIKINQS